MTYLYATPNTLVLQHKKLPPTFPKEQPTYERSGWVRQPRREPRSCMQCA